MHIYNPINHEVSILHSTLKFLFTTLKLDHFNLFDLLCCVFVDFIICYWKINYRDTVDYQYYCLNNYRDGEKATHPQILDSHSSNFAILCMYESECKAIHKHR